MTHLTLHEEALRALAQAYDREQSAQRGEPDPWMLDDPGDISDSDTWVSERLACAELAARALFDALWQPIETAPKTPMDDDASSGPVILLASISGHRAIGYWGRGIANQRHGWVSLHDHMIMSYGTSFTHWCPIPAPPAQKGGA